MLRRLHAGRLPAAYLLVVIVALVLARGRGRLLSCRGGRAGRRASSRAGIARERGPVEASWCHASSSDRSARSDTPAAGGWRISAIMLVLEDTAE